MAYSHREDSLIEKRLEEQEAYVASRDYQVTKASRMGKPVDQVYPGHTKWYDAEIEILHDLEDQLKKADPAAWKKVILRRNCGKPD